MAALCAIVVDCVHAPTPARFWAAALDGYDVLPDDETEIARLAGLGLTPATDPTVAVGGPGPTLFFQQVPGRKIVKNRIHLGVEAPDRAAEVDRLVAPGVSVHDVQDRWTVPLDPRGQRVLPGAAGLTGRWHFVRRHGGRPTPHAGCS